MKTEVKGDLTWTHRRGRGNVAREAETVVIWPKAQESLQSEVGKGKDQPSHTAFRGTAVLPTPAFPTSGLQNYEGVNFSLFF